MGPLSRAIPVFFAASLVCSLAFSASCTNKRRRPIVSVQVVDRAGIGVDPSQRLDRRLIETSAAAAISERLPDFEVRDAKKDEPGWQLTVAVQLTAERDARPEDGGAPPKDAVFRAVGVTMKLEALSANPKSGVRERYEADTLIGKNTPMFDDFQVLMQEALRDAAASIRVERELLEANEAELVAKIGVNDPRVRARAVSIAGERKLKAAVPALIEILKKEDEVPEVVFKAIGALVAIGDPRAVGPLIDTARQRPPAYLGQILFGVAQIGGKEAEAYLFTVANGHPDPEVRKNAQDALSELNSRQPKPANEGDNDG